MFLDFILKLFKNSRPKPKPVPTPTPTRVRKVTATFSGPLTPTGSLKVDNSEEFPVQFDAPFHLIIFLGANTPAPFGATLTLSSEGYDTLTYRFTLSGESNQVLPDLNLLSTAPVFPTYIPSREAVLGVKTHFMGGQTVDSQKFGKMPWWDACLAWCDPETRQAAYTVKRESGDTHQIIHIPSGPPLYSSGDNRQFYNPSRFPELDWTNGMTALDSRFTDLVDEVIINGFFPIITVDERYEFSIKLVEMVMKTLRDDQVPFCLTLPGYDGVFYGWEPSGDLIPGWAAKARSIKPSCYLGLEFNPGHIPIGEGGEDYAPGGRMKDYDVILGEFPTVHPRPSTDNLDEANQVWQIVGRLVNPYLRPSEQPADDDPRPPFYLQDSSRGPRTFIAFETWNPYNWVRVDISNPQAVAQAQAQINSEREYFRSLGCRYTG